MLPPVLRAWSDLLWNLEIRRRSEHAGHLLPDQPPNSPLLRSGHPLYCPWFLHQGGIQPSRYAGDDRPVVVSIVELGRRGHRYRSGSPNVVRRVVEVAGILILSRCARAARPKSGNAMRGADCGQAGEALRKGGTATGLLGQDDFVEQSDGGVRWRCSFAFMNKFVER